MNPSPDKLPIVMLAADGHSTRIIYHYLKEHFRIEMVIMEKPLAKKDLIRNRLRRLGFVTVFGQLVFQTTISKYLTVVSGKRVREIIDEHQLDTSPIDEELIHRVNSVNDPAIRELVEGSTARVVLVNGTRIISDSLLRASKKIIINTHLGITPKYRGVHGGYWALASDDPNHFGATVHLVDAGIDTGKVLAQAMAVPGKKDNFNTYPYLQLAAVLPAIKRVLEKVTITGIPEPVHLQEKVSHLYYHPTAWQYLWTRIVNGVK